MPSLFFIELDLYTLLYLYLELMHKQLTKTHFVMKYAAHLVGPTSFY